ncbi:HEPN domain-containing protein [Nocardia abscessus]|uniref:HEPN domain-containing protein n=1 Tax=Nocardia abscessus TaxID=120957 RepID=UPI002458E019|nr:HEPN domain-containing protein [Nocardia abscessus]
MTGYCFRNTVELRPDDRVVVDRQEQSITLARDGAIAVKIRPLLPVENFREASKLLLEGGPYGTFEEAVSAGKAWRDYLLLAFSAHSVAIDIGDDDDPRAKPNPLLAEKAEELGIQALWDRHGLLVYRANPPATFGKFSASATALRSGDQLARSIDAIRNLNHTVAEPQRLALKLIHSSLFDHNPETKFVLLVTAIEAIIEKKARSEQIVEWIDQLISETQRSKLSPEDQLVVANYLGLGKQESIGSAGKRAVSVLGSRRYDEKSPKKFLAECYTARSNIVHGNLSRPKSSELWRVIPILERFVVDLINIGIAEGEMPQWLDSLRGSAEGQASV